MEKGMDMSRNILKYKWDFCHKITENNCFDEKYKYPEVKQLSIFRVNVYNAALRIENMNYFCKSK